MAKNELLRLLESVGALVQGSHIVYTSGRHGSSYVNKDALYPHPSEVSKVCRMLAERVREMTPEVVVAPAMGGVVLSQWVAFHLGELLGMEVLGVYAEKENEKFVLARGYGQLVRGKRTLVVEDVLTTGGSVKKVVQTVREAGGIVVGVGALCNRGGISPQDIGDVPRLEALLELSLASFAPGECPLCRQGVPINQEIGKGGLKSKR